MKAKRLLFLVMAICLASGVKAQFYDGPDDIYYYVKQCHEREETYSQLNFPYGYVTKKNGRIKKEIPQEGQENVYVFNFDGLKAAQLGGMSVYSVKSKLVESPSWFEDRVETTNYDWKYVSSSSSGIIYKKTGDNSNTFTFSSDRNTLIKEWYISTEDGPARFWDTYKRVDKSFFKVGRSRTPSGTLHE